MHFGHAPEIWSEFPGLGAGAMFAEGIAPNISAASRIAGFNAIAAQRLATQSEGELPEIQAWRRAFSKMGLKPTQYRCASEQLLRRFRQDRALPEIHPLIDLCNAISMAFAIPIAVFDVSHVADHLTVRAATGDETYRTFAGEIEHPEAGEIIFADGEGQAHARRWTNRQSGTSAVRHETAAVLVVAEALHATADQDIARLMATLATEVEAIWSIATSTGRLHPSTPRFTF
ncbi:MAG: B3/B4 domain-containing protein [Phreatobacter sp.]